MWSKSRLNWVELSSESNKSILAQVRQRKQGPKVQADTKAHFELIVWSEFRARNDNKQFATVSVHVTRVFINHHSFLFKVFEEGLPLFESSNLRKFGRHPCYRIWWCLRWSTCEWKNGNCGALVIIFDRKIKSPNAKYNTLQTTQLDYLSWM